MPTVSKLITYYAPTLEKESSDKPRSLIGGYFESFEEEQDKVQFEEPFLDSDLSTRFYSLSNDISYLDGLIVKRTEDQTSISDDLIYKSLSAPILIYGNKHVIRDDLEWQKIIMGGDYSTETYPGIYATQVFEGYSSELSLPYDLREAKERTLENIDDPADYSILECKYQTYLKTYEEAAGRRSVYELPNIYFMYLRSTLDPSYNLSTNTWEQDNEYAKRLNEYVYLDSTYDAAKIKEAIADYAEFDWPPPYVPDYAILGSYVGAAPDVAYNMNEYYRTWASTEYSTETKQFLSEKMKNIFFLDDPPELTDDKGDIIANTWLDVLSTYALSLPFYASLNLKSVGTSPNSSDPSYNSWIEFNDAWNAADFNKTILFHIKDKFVNKNPNIQDVNKYTKHESNEETTLSQVMLRYADFNKILFEEMNNPKFADKDSLSISSEGIEVELLRDDEEAANYRSLRTSRATNFLEFLTEKITKSFDDGWPFSNTTATNWRLWQFLEDPHASLGSDASGDKNITVAYRIEKISNTSGAVTTSPTVLQNFYFPQSEINDTDNIFVDTQVKYGETYTYNVYAYRFVMSYRYRYKDFRISESIGDIDENNITSYCLQFYDPITEEPAQLGWFRDRDTIDWSHDDPLPLASEVATDAQGISTEYKYIAETELQIEPCIRIYEIPVHSKEITIMDNPPREVNIVPYQRKDNSQVIGFFATKGGFVKTSYPTAVTAADEEEKEKYLMSVNLISEENVDEPSISALRYLQIFRIDKEPTSLTDFDGSLIAEKDLKIEQRLFPSLEDEEDFISTLQVSPVCFYEEKIQTNKTYYYLFRFLNEHRIAGRCSPVQVIKLMDDGGYKYLNSDIILESELKSATKYEKVSVSFNKLLQILPNVSQIRLDTDAVDYDQDAYSQVDKVGVGTAEDLVWGKTFKVRMTSKKTGKKIDLNVTYNLKDSV